MQIWRRNLIYWLYAVGLVHLAIGLVMPLTIDLPIFDFYHQIVETQFWHGKAPVAGHLEQVWWISLFGATLQNLAVWMVALVRLGDVHRSRFAWMSLLAGVLLWAPQDIWISYRAGVMLHVWVDLIALSSLIPPLLILWTIDKEIP